MHLVQSRDPTAGPAASSLRELCVGGELRLLSVQVCGSAWRRPGPILRVSYHDLPAILYILYLVIGRGSDESQTFHRRPLQEASPRFERKEERGGQLTHFHRRNRADDDRNPVRTARSPSAESPSRPSSVSEIVSSNLICPRCWQGQNATTRIHDNSQADDTGLKKMRLFW